MKARLLKNGGIMFCVAQDKDTRSGFLMLSDNFGMWFGVDEFEFIESPPSVIKKRLLTF